MGVLDTALKSSDPEFVAVYGRRRVGKTFLVREFFGDTLCFELTGLHNTSMSDQLENFAQALGKAAGQGTLPRPPASWREAFHQLEQFLESSKPSRSRRKRVVFLDELPWLDTRRAKFCSALEHFWNSWASRQNDLILVACGSAASWMIQNVVQAKGGLHNRVTRRIRLLPFTVGETEAFLQSRGVELTRRQIIELYMVLGGVPHYLKEAEPGLSTPQIVDHACFSSQGLLRDEFKKLYTSLFDNAEQHIRIVEALARKREGLSRNELLAAAGLPSGGTTTKRMDELEESGFLQRHVPFGKKENDALYRLADEFSLFHIAWIRPLGKRSPGDSYWLQQSVAPRWRAWSAYAFEGLCLKHVPQLKAALGIAGVSTTGASWRYRPPKGSSERGAQVDLLIDRRDQTINLCEMKFSDAEFTIDKRYATELRNKRDIFRRVTGTRKNVFLTMVTTFGVADNAYAKELVAKSLTMDALF
jgi:hypothetical protein